MKDPIDRPSDFSDLRRRAKAMLESEAISPEELSTDQAARLIQELQVHQIELELQNEELRLSQTRLEESRRRYADLYDFAPVGYLTLDRRGRIVEANLTAATLLGVDRSKLLNRVFSHFLTDADRRIFRQLHNNGLNLPERRGEFHLKNGNGDVRVIQFNIIVHRDAEGQERWRVSMTDITDLKCVQEELRIHEEDLEKLVAERTAELIQVKEQLKVANDYLKGLFQATPLAIGVFDTKGRLMATNPASERIFGWSPEEVKNRPLPSIPKKAPEKALAVLNRALRGETFVGAEVKHQRRDGVIIDVSLSAAPLHDGEGSFRGFVGVAEDITQRKQAEEALRNSEQRLRHLSSQLLRIQEEERGRIAKELHDELGQALMVLKFQIESIEAGLAQGKKQVMADFQAVLHYLEGVIEKVRRLSRDLSPALLGELGLSQAIKTLLEEFGEYFEIRWWREGVEELDQLFSPLAAVNIYRIFQESLTNIGRHAQASKISVSIEKQNGSVVFTVEDNGRGFEVDEVWSREGREKGIGLASMEERAQLAGGSLKIWSQPGVGTKITFAIPLNKKAE